MSQRERATGSQGNAAALSHIQINQSKVVDMKTPMVASVEVGKDKTTNNGEDQ